MKTSQLRLLLSRRLLPFFSAQFLGAVNDNLFKNALIILVAYRDTESAMATQVVVTIAAALFILPYFLFSASAGQLADKYEKTALVRVIKLWEIGVVILATAAFIIGNVTAQLCVLFLLGTQAAFFGPVKYGILPELLGEDDLVQGNALIEAGTFLAILIGTIAGGLLILAPHGIAIVSLVLLALALGGWAASLAIPRTTSTAPALRFNFNIAAETWAILRRALAQRNLRRPVLGISWFWAVGAGYLSQFPNFAKDSLRADNGVVTFFLALFTIGIGIGSVLCGRLQKGEISARLVPWGAIGMTFFAFDLWLATPAGGSGQALIGIGGFLQSPGHWRIALDLFALALFGGLFAVPLYVLMQARSAEHQRARVVAANNVLNALFMVAVGIISAAMLQRGWGVEGVFLGLALGNLAVAVLGAHRW